MKRLFTILSALSLVLCICVAAIWARSYWCDEAIGWGQNGSRSWMLGVQWERGTLAFAVVTTDQTGRLLEQSGTFWRRFPTGMFPVRSWWNRRGFIWVHDHGSGLKQWALGVPCWLILFSVGVMPAVWLRRSAHLRRRRFREQQGLCLHCGYDLRASKERCPECGTAIPERMVGGHPT